MLQLNSMSVQQQFTYYCKNSLAWKDENNNKNKAVVLFGPSNKRYNTAQFDNENVIDGCAVSFISNLYKVLVDAHMI